MQITGHKTRSVYDRYRIVNMTDIRQATRKLERTQKNLSPGSGEFSPWVTN